MLWFLFDLNKIKIAEVKFEPRFTAAFIQNRSFINKKIMLLDTSTLIFPYYGSQEFNNYLMKNKKISKILHVLRYRELFEKTLKDDAYLENAKFEIETYYYPYDYTFPNISLVWYNKCEKSIWLKRIKAYYYSKSDSNWYKLIK